MNIPVLCIIQARYNSTRLPGKMLCELGGESLIARGVRIACEAFGPENVVVACCSIDKCSPLADELARIGATVHWYNGAESDVLARFFECAHTYRWHPDSVLVRYTPDDAQKSVSMLRRVASGERLPVEWGGEAFTLAMLDEAQRRCVTVREREHISFALFRFPAPSTFDARQSTIDTVEDLEAARARVVACK